MHPELGSTSRGWKALAFVPGPVWLRGQLRGASSVVFFGKNVNIWLGFAGKGTASAGTAWAGLRGCAADRKMRMVRVFWSESILCHSGMARTGGAVPNPLPPEVCPGAGGHLQRSHPWDRCGHTPARGLPWGQIKGSVPPRRSVVVMALPSARPQNPVQRIKY